MRMLVWRYSLRYSILRELYELCQRVVVKLQDEFASWTLCCGEQERWCYIQKSFEADLRRNGS